MEENLEQPHVEAPETEAEAVAETPHLETEVTEKQPAAEDKAQEKKAVITPEIQAEIDRIISEKTAKMRADTSEAEKRAAQIVMQRQIEQANAEEAKARAKDQQDLDNGFITEDQLNQRAKDRQDQKQLRQTLQKQRQEADALGKVMLANDLAKEYGIEADALLNDQAITDPLTMVRKASKMALDALKTQLKEATVKPESFDRGPGAITENSDSFTGTVTQAQLDSDAYWNKHKDKILKAQREGKLKVL